MLRIVLLALAAAVVAQESGPLVWTVYGTVRGTRNVEGGYSSFTGIRYAQAPTGRNRFRSASRPPSWDGIFEANRNDIVCPQIENDTFIGVEDCLTLNIYTPDVATFQNPVPVMVYFHGGAFITGSVRIFSGEFLIKHDVIVILVNFRVSAFGHLCLRHELIPGNAAFKDQVAALRWVQQNIASFGGDPDNVTIMGHSAGAASVDLLTLSPMANGLFHKAIAISGSARAIWAVSSDPIKYATSIAQAYLDYVGDSIEDLVETYLNAEDKDLAQAIAQYFSHLQRGTFPIGACVEQILPGVDAFLTVSPTDIMLTGRYTHIPMIYAVTNKEYVNIVSLAEIENAEDVMQNLENYLPDDLIFSSNEQRTEIANRLRNFYVKEETSILESYIDYRSDMMFYYAVTRAARQRPSTSAARIYMLEFTYESERRFPRLPETAGITGAAHGDDMLYLILSMDSGLPITPTDQLTIDRYTKWLTTFAKYSNPTPDLDDLQWLPMTENQFRYLQLGSDASLLIDPHPGAIALWNQIYAELIPNRPMAQTAQGWVRGMHHSKESYSSFTGIHYARAPTGRNRFRSPLHLLSWNGIFEANRNDIACSQMEGDMFIGVEDCLTLNIYKPDVATPENPVAVMVYFYGGAFVMGSVPIYSEEFLIKHDVIVVLVNFRVSALGHLCLKHELIPGNAAFKDQVDALRWLRQNIAAFGGDPNNVTIMGHSAGAASVDLLTLSPMSSSFFRKSVVISGSAQAFWAINPDPIRYATTMAQNYLGYNGNSIEDLVEFYLNSEDKDLAQATTQYYIDLQHSSLPFAACIEDVFPGIETFLRYSPAEIILAEQYRPKPMIYIVANKEYLSMIVPNEVENAENFMQHLEDNLPKDLLFYSDQQQMEIANRVRDFYLKEGKPILESYIDYKSDTMFYNAVTRGAKQHPFTSTAPIYFLEFTYESKRRLPRLPETAEMAGAAHGDDSLYLILSNVMGVPLTPADQLTIDRYTTFLTNFAKYSNPTPNADELQWLPMTDNQFHYLELGSEVTPLINPHAEAIALWDQIYVEASPYVPMVRTSQGWVRGTHHFKESYSSFLGIPYGEWSRFQSPSRARDWSGIFVADENVFCPQMWNGDYIGTKNCLVLNIYTPDAASVTNQLAVIVYIHGGFHESSSSYFGPDQLLPHDVVLVTINYRSGVHGYLCLMIPMIPGNTAFRDQVAALRWVQGNIAVFGGNPNNVTIMGSGSGGASVDLLTLSPTAAGLFERAISMSGAARASWALANYDDHDNTMTVARTLAEKYMNFTDTNSFSSLIHFYNEVDIEVLTRATFRFHQEFGPTYLSFGTCIEESRWDGAFLTDTPANILASKNYTPVPTIYTMTNKEYVSMITPREISNISEIVKHIGEYLPQDLIISHNRRSYFANRVRAFYFNDQRSHLEGYIDFMSDIMFYHGLARSARERQATSTLPVYVMEFAFESQLRKERLDEVDGITGTGHGDDLLFIIARIRANVTLSAADKLTMRRYGKLYSNFAKFGNPTPENVPVNWQPITGEQLNYLQLGTEMTTFHSPHAASIAFWDEIYAEASSSKMFPTIFAIFFLALLVLFNI